LEAVKMAGLEGSIVIDSKDVSYPAIEVLNGFSFECDPDINMLAGTAGHSWKSEDVKVLVIDGVVEKVSEIDRILNYGVENRSPIVIFARGFSYDVISTIVLNQHRGVLNVLCVGVPIEESNPNKLVDIAVVTGSDVVSTLKGELISSIIPEDLPDVSSIKATNGKIVISNSKKRDSLRFHIDRLKKLREEKENDLDYLDERIKSLTGRTVKIILPKKDEATNVLTAERIDIILRTLRSLIGFGKINFKILRGELKKEETFISDITLKKLSRLPVIPSSSIALGARDAKVLSNLLTGIENAVLFN
jgi:chaperonin GroEL (HSP60 family)